jgi:opacity protein-like surface antigen
MSFKRLIYTFVICLIISVRVSAQYSEIGLGGGFSTYWGDLNGPVFPVNITTNSGIAFQLSYRKYFRNKFGLRGTFSFGKVSGDDSKSNFEWQRLRNLSFYSSISELAVMGEFYFFGFNTEPGSTAFTPYITAGIAGFRFDPKTTYGGREVRLQPLGTEGQGIPGFKSKYNLASFSFPIGAGGKIILSEKINIGGEVVMRWALTDYLDDISGRYVTYEDLLAKNGALAASLGNRMNEFLGQSEPVILETGSVRGGEKVKDYYFISTVSVNIIMDSGGFMGNRRKNRVNCPTF